MTTQYSLQIRNLSKSFAGNGNGVTHALRGVDLLVQPQEFLVVVGPNGSGKTTLLNLLAGDITPDAGQILLQNAQGARDWLAIPRWERASHLARVYQDPRRGTAAGMTVWENLRLASSKQAVPRPWTFSPTEHDPEWYRARLERLGLGDRMNARVADLSQGQRQLLAVELAFLRKPALLLLDEHTASLDQANANRCLEATLDLSRESGASVIMVTHNLMDALKYGDRLVVVRDGQIANTSGGREKQGLSLEALLKLCGYVA